MAASSSKFFEIASLRQAIFTREFLSVVAGNFSLHFSLKCLPIFVQGSGSIESGSGGK